MPSYSTIFASFYEMNKTLNIHGIGQVVLRNTISFSKKVMLSSTTFTNSVFFQMKSYFKKNTISFFFFLLKSCI